MDKRLHIFKPNRPLKEVSWIQNISSPRLAANRGKWALSTQRSNRQQMENRFIQISRGLCTKEHRLVGSIIFANNCPKCISSNAKSYSRRLQVAAQRNLNSLFLIYTKENRLTLLKLHISSFRCHSIFFLFLPFSMSFAPWTFERTTHADQKLKFFA